MSSQLLLLISIALSHDLLASERTKKSAHSQIASALLLEGSFTTFDTSPAHGLVASGNTRGAIKIWSSADRRLIFSVNLFEAPSTLALSKDGKMVAVASSQSADVKLYDISAGKLLFSFTPSVARTFVSALAFSTDSKFIAGGMDNGGHFFVFDIAERRETFSGRHSTGRVAVRFSNESERLYTGGTDGLLKRHNHRSGESIAFPREHKSQINSISVSNDGRSIATSGKHDGKIVFWNAREIRMMRTFTVGDIVYSIDVSPDASFIAAGTGLVSKVQSKQELGQVHYVAKPDSNQPLVESARIEKHQVTIVRFLNDDSFLALGHAGMHLIKIENR